MAKVDFSVFARDRHYAEVNIMTEPPIQTHLGFAGLASLRQRREIEKTQIEWFLDLVNKRRRQRDNRDVRLPDLHLLRFLRIRSRRAQKFQ